MKAVLLAAGSSTRLRAVTRERPKCLLEVGGLTLLEHQLDALAAGASVGEVVIVTGYLSHVLAERVGQVRARYPFALALAHNPLYAETNNLYSLWAARGFVEGHAFLCLHADLLFHPEVLRACARSDEDACLVADREVLEETMKLRARGGRLIAVGKHVTMGEADGTFLGLARFSEEGGRRVFEEVGNLVAAGDTNVYFTEAVQRLADKGFPVGVSFIEGLPWIEIDFPEELERARREVYARIEGRGRTGDVEPHEKGAGRVPHRRAGSVRLPGS